MSSWQTIVNSPEWDAMWRSDELHKIAELHAAVLLSGDGDVAHARGFLDALYKIQYLPARLLNDQAGPGEPKIPVEPKKRFLRGLIDKLYAAGDRVGLPGGLVNSPSPASTGTARGGP